MSRKDHLRAVEWLLVMGEAAGLAVIAGGEGFSSRTLNESGKLSPSFVEAADIYHHVLGTFRPSIIPGADDMRCFKSLCDFRLRPE